MIAATNIGLRYGDRVLFDEINLVIKEGDRIGLVGRNGAGKSTLLRILSGMQTPDTGTVARPSQSTLGFLHQEMTLPRGRTVLDEAMTAFQEMRALEEKILHVTQEMASRTDFESPGYSKLLEIYTELHDRFELLGGATTQADAEKVLKGLGFRQSDFNRQTTEFSGGWQMRVELTKMLLQQPDYLFLDEPTNHLDIESIIWLEQFLRDYPGAVVVISHDQAFLDNVTNRTVELELGKLFDYRAPYSEYLVLREERREKLLSAFENQQRVIAQKERTINRFIAKANKTKMAQSMQKQLNKMERIELDSEDTDTMNLRFPPAPRSGQIVLEAHRISKDYGNVEVLRQVDIKLDRGDRVAFVGQNGQGKTTLAKILINEIQASSGTVKLGHNVLVGYYAQQQSDSMHSKQTVLETMEAASPAEMRTRLRAILGAFLFSGGDVDKKVGMLSGGERSRLALACLLLRPFNLLVLDEPTNHLDILSKEVLKEALLQYDGTLIVVSHDREFLRGLTNRTIEFRDHQLHDYLGDVDFFLEKRALENMREVEKSTAKTAGAPQPVKRIVDFEERKRIQRQLSKAEKAVEDLEAQIKKIESQMAQEDFYARPDQAKTLEKYQLMKKDLDAALAEWETAQETWEEIAE